MVVPVRLKTHNVIEKLGALDMRVVADCEGAQCVFIASGISDNEMGARSRWAAALRGSWVVSPASLIHNSGLAVKFKAAYATKRSIWVSDKFKAELTPLWNLIETDLNYALGAGVYCIMSCIVTPGECTYSVATCFVFLTKMK